MNALTAKRLLSVVVMLTDNSEYEGGELGIKYEFLEGFLYLFECTATFSLFGSRVNRDEMNMTREIGTVFTFPSYVLHRVTPVTKGFRYSMVTWVEGY